MWVYIDIDIARTASEHRLTLANWATATCYNISMAHKWCVFFSSLLGNVYILQVNTLCIVYTPLSMCDMVRCNRFGLMRKNFKINRNKVWDCFCICCFFFSFTFFRLSKWQKDKKKVNHEWELGSSEAKELEWRELKVHDDRGWLRNEHTLLYTTQWSCLYSHL